MGELLVPFNVRLRAEFFPHLRAYAHPMLNVEGLQSLSREKSSLKILFNFNTGFLLLNLTRGRCLNHFYLSWFWLYPLGPFASGTNHQILYNRAWGAMVKWWELLHEEQEDLDSSPALSLFGLIEVGKKLRNWWSKVVSCKHTQK